MKSKQAQITIFIIVAIVIIAIIALFMILKLKITPTGPSANAEENPSEFLKECINEQVNQGVELISHQGGYLSNPLNISFTDNKLGTYEVSFLCYTWGEGRCQNQEAGLTRRFEIELEDYIEPKVRSCVESKLKTALEKRGYDVVAEYDDLTVGIAPEMIEIKINGNIEFKKGEINKKIQRFEIKIPEKSVYWFIQTAEKIVNEEIFFCEFDISKNNVVNSKVFVERFDISSQKTEIYTLKDLSNNKFFRFAIRDGDC